MTISELEVCYYTPVSVHTSFKCNLIWIVRAFFTVTCRHVGCHLTVWSLNDTQNSTSQNGLKKLKKFKFKRSTHFVSPWYLKMSWWMRMILKCRNFPRMSSIDLGGYQSRGKRVIDKISVKLGYFSVFLQISLKL